MRSVRDAIIPQPMSTPTAAGMTAPFVGMTEPTVEPMPRCASGMRATWPSTMGRRAAFSAWRSVSGSRSLTQEISLSLILVGTTPPLGPALIIVDRGGVACRRRNGWASIPNRPLCRVTASRPSLPAARGA